MLFLKSNIIKIIKLLFPIISVILIIINNKVIEFRKTNNNKFLYDSLENTSQLTNNYLDFEVQRYQYLLNLALSNTLSYNQSNEIIFKYEKPKISVIISVYNREEYIKSALTSVQNQNMKDIEIIIVDDFSNDNSTKIIYQEMIKDKRIIFHKNHKNMGNLYTKSVGVKMAKGEYVLTLDSDDILLPDNLLNSIYKEAKKKSYDIIEFEKFWIQKYNITKKMFLHKNSFELYQPKLQKGFWTSSKTCMITAKIIKSQIYQKALELIGEENLKIRLTNYDDNLIMSIIYTIARSFKHINKYGYFAYRHSNSTSHVKNEIECYNSIVYVSLLHKMYKQLKNNYIYLNEIRLKIRPWEIDSYCINNARTKDIKLAIGIFVLLIKDKHINNYLIKKIANILKSINIDS